ncbi:hypothetical protein L249_3085 [Ophiocordyceps polyrhachis-furcata BCC 54312]|uniref:Uncharacterized protein n=1 Tax=Ophiocordyceps polyrhachis-furcata BCC 54312 TaxID=1330021 RepID=A0A367LNW5_9HYPO|nr:hypothetical protein L249_3085 [Ophiocordyceps polyrhachis-furcata BCC 54312]
MRNCARAPATHGWVGLAGLELQLMAGATQLISSNLLGTVSLNARD